jgi:nucleoside 2-deoxyribosyltransferase
VKVYITARFKGADNRKEIEELCAAVRAADMEDFCFVRDIEHYKHTFDDPKDLWAKAYDEIGACDALLIDVSDNPTGGRLVETGIAYALRKPVIVIKKHGAGHKSLFDGVSATVITYEDSKDLTIQLKKFENERNFNLTDKTAMLVMFLMVGAVIAWVLAQFFIPLGAIAATGYWLVVRHVFAPIRAFDRLVIYIPLIAVWLAGFFVLQPINPALVLAWTIIFWAATLYVLRKIKFSL